VSPIASEDDSSWNPVGLQVRCWGIDVKKYTFSAILIAWFHFTRNRKLLWRFSTSCNNKTYLVLQYNGRWFAPSFIQFGFLFWFPLKSPASNFTKISLIHAEKRDGHSISNTHCKRLCWSAKKILLHKKGICISIYGFYWASC
jgi:hypothetical protein